MRIQFFSEVTVKYDAVCANCQGHFRIGFLIKPETIAETAKILIEENPCSWLEPYISHKTPVCYSCAMRWFAPVFYRIISKALGKQHHKFEITERFCEEGYYINETEETEQAWWGKSAKQIKRLKEAGKIIEVKPEIV